MGCFLLGAGLLLAWGASAAGSAGTGVLTTRAGFTVGSVSSNGAGAAGAGAADSAFFFRGARVLGATAVATLALEAVAFSTPAEADVIGVSSALLARRRGFFLMSLVCSSVSNSGCWAGSVIMIVGLFATGAFHRLLIRK